MGFIKHVVFKLKIQDDVGEPGHNNLIANTQTPVKTVERSFSAEPTNGNQATRYSTGTDTRDIVVGVRVAWFPFVGSALELRSTVLTGV
jgi:hypothetical protein